MADDKDRIEQLLAKLSELMLKQEAFKTEINQLRHEINVFRNMQNFQPPVENVVKETPAIKDPVETPAEKINPVVPPVQETKAPTVYRNPVAQKPSKPLVSKEDWEKFIGENLINKIGIVITVIGVGIGAKYSIDHQLISPLTRIILGYLVGVALMGVAIKLKKDYGNFSAVLLSGSMAILYLITFVAYSLYGIIPQAAAFGLMVLFTIFTVIAAINYNRQVIAHIGLVGAYAVPFLLSDGSGKVFILFTYMAIINTGILVIAFKKYWKPLLYVSFLFTWLIYGSWFLSKYDIDQPARLAFSFLSIFFAIFYAAILSYKLIRNEKFVVEDIILLLANSFVFFGTGYAIMYDHPLGSQLLGLFTLANAIIHFGVSVLIYKNKLADRNFFFLVAGLVLVFITIAIPVQLNGHWVTLLWATEAALVFWIGRTRQVTFYELLSYPLMMLAFFSLLQDWNFAYHIYIKAGRIPIFNIHFLLSLIFIGSFAFITYTNRREKYLTDALRKNGIVEIFSYIIPTILILVTYGAFLKEISMYWNQLYNASVFQLNDVYRSDWDLMLFRNIWIINYSMLFLSCLSMANIYKFKNEQLGLANLALNVVALLAFLVQGLYLLSELRDSYISQELVQYYNRGIFHLLIRYVSYGFAGLVLFSCYGYTRQEFLKENFKVPFELIFYTALLWVASSELVNYMRLQRFEHTFKLELSILWGCYALLLIVLGIWKKKQHLRIAAIVLFTVTLLKLFFYDISYLDTIAKTIVFVSLGLLMLVISFLYNKYKHVISGESKS